MALPKTKPKPPPEPEQEPWSLEEATPSSGKSIASSAWIRRSSPPNGTWPPRTIYPPDYFHLDGTPRAVAISRDPKAQQFEA
jgi:hypothetical protein